MQGAGTRWHGIGGLGRGGLGQAGQSIGEIVDARVAAGALGVFQAIFEQRAERLVAGLTRVTLGIVDQIRQGIDGCPPLVALDLRRVHGVCRGGALGLSALLQGQAQGRQVSQGVGVGVEGLCSEWLLRQLGKRLRLCRGSLQHRRHRLGLGLNQLRPRLRISDLAGHQAGITQPRVVCGWRLIFGWQFVAVIGNRRLVGSVFLAAVCHLRFILGLGLGDLVVVPERLLLGHDLAEAAARVALRLQRLVGNRAGCSRRFAYGAWLQQRIGCDRH
ncbi:hypothetical protein D3C81_1376220 [compost metagenome]